MGATVLTNMAATTFVGQPDGTQYVALWEECFEKNVYPHTPSWCCRYFGSYAGAISTIFASASACEGGMLRTRNGTMKPEQYINRWSKAFRSATEQPDVFVDVRFGSGIYELALDTQPAIRATCAQHNLSSAVMSAPGEELVRLRFRLSDAGGAALCSALSQRGTLGGYVTIWKMLRGGPPRDTPTAPVAVPERLGGTDRTAENMVPVPLPTAYALLPAGEREYLDHLVIHHDGAVIIEWPYSHIGTFATTMATTAELHKSGSGAPLISQFRAALAEAVVAPDNLRLRITREPSSSCAYPQNARASFDALVAATAARGRGPRHGVVDQQGGTLSISVGQLRACGALTKLRQLVHGQLTVDSRSAIDTTGLSAALVDV